MNRIQFSKLEGLGNDFLVASGTGIAEEQLPGLALRSCQRNFGVGADGLVFFWPPLDAKENHFRMRVFNADGGEAEMSGNGLRCLAAYLYHAGRHKAEVLRVESVAGVKVLQLTQANPPVYSFAVDMGHPILELARIPFTPPQTPQSLIGYKLPVLDETFTVTITSMGNPHCSIFVDDFDALDLERIGAHIERHPFFPNRTNVEFIKVLKPDAIEVRFWERGVGKTLASGTGSCAAIVASILNGGIDADVTVHTLGGILQLHWAQGESVRLKGPARVICDGEYFFDL